MAPFEYEWDEYPVVTAFGVSDNFQKVIDWYSRTHPNLWLNVEDDYHIYSFEKGDIHLADAKNESGLEGLNAFFGSTVLYEYSMNQQFEVVGVLRLIR